MILNLDEEFFHRLISPLVAPKIIRRMTSKFKVLIKISINRFRLFHSTIMLGRPDVILGIYIFKNP